MKLIRFTTLVRVILGCPQHCLSLLWTFLFSLLDQWPCHETVPSSPRRDDGPGEKVHPQRPRRHAPLHHGWSGPDSTGESWRADGPEFICNHTEMNQTLHKDSRFSVSLKEKGSQLFVVVILSIKRNAFAWFWMLFFYPKSATSLIALTCCRAMLSFHQIDSVMKCFCNYREDSRKQSLLKDGGSSCSY